MSTVRLTCPNCKAQYEVPLDVIPDTGRDVQCSNCSFTWFQVHPDSISDEPDDAPVGLDSDTSKPTEPGFDTADDEEAEAIEKDFDQPRPRLDPAIADILRGEAALEISKRNTERAEPPATADLKDASETTAVNDAMTSPFDHDLISRVVRGEPLDDDSLDTENSDTATAESVTPRRTLLPDVETVKDTLNPNDDGPQKDLTDDPDHAVDQAKGAGNTAFKRGFASMLIIAALALGVYMAAPQMSGQFPKAAPALSTYVNWVNQRRAQLTQGASKIVLQFENMIDNLSSPTQSDSGE